MEIRRIVLTTDFSPCARRAYARVADLARRFGAGVELVYARENLLAYASLGLGAVGKAMERYRRAAERRLGEELGHEAFTGVELCARVVEGHGPRGVASHAEEAAADLLVQAAHGRSGFRRLVLGSFAERVLRHSTVPVLTLKEEEDGEPEPLQVRSILYPYDLSALSRAALGWVRFWARSFGAEVIVCHAVWDLVHVPPLGGVDDEGASSEAEELRLANEELPVRLREELEAFRARELEGIPSVVRVETGWPAEVIPEVQAECGADLICMATHGWTGLRHVLMGSVAETVCRRALCPVLTVRPPPASWKEELRSA